MSNPLPPKLNEIAKLLNLPRPQLVVVVGAGVSLGATGLPYASWSGLLKHGINYLVQRQFQQQWGIQLEASLEASFSPFNLKNALQHAELVEQALNTPDATAFADWLMSAFSSFKARNDGRDTLEALRDLQEAGALLLTTNYDGLLSDITNSAPVTWEEHPDFLRVITRQKLGILHIHGHWHRPSSIVLGRSSYDRVVADEDFQQLFKTLWLEYSWLYVGCGDGLDDPNLGRLLEWGKRWGESAMPDYFLAREDKAVEIDNRAEKPKNLVSIGYSCYDDLPKILHSITPSARSWPFVRVDKEFPLFRAPGSNIPFPTRQEYLDGDVPPLDADAEVKQRLLTHGWACVLDLASMGKTTLALRLATAPEQRERSVFYFDLKTEILDDAEGRPDAALGRLARPGALLILDNIHHQPELARQLWQQWKADPRDSRLLIVATKIQPHLLTTPAQDLIFFEKHPTNPAIFLEVGPSDLGRIAAHIFRRVTGTSMPEPSMEALTEWNRDYRAALNAFTFAVMRGLSDLQRRNWLLPPSYASEWVREVWLKTLDERELQNVVCLAAFGAQELEMFVQDSVLPYPGKVGEMLRIGLVVRTDVGRFGQYHRFSLREPGWGRLILAALERPVDVESILFDAAARNPTMALIMSRRLETEGLALTRERLWESLAANQEVLASNLFLADVPLSIVGNLLKEAQASNHAPLTSFLWQTIESQRNKLAVHAWETSLDIVGSFLEWAKRQGRETSALWEAIESQPDKVATCAWQTPLDKLGWFLEVAERQRRNTNSLWEAIERQLDKFAARALETPLNDIGSFLKVAKRQKRNTNPLWEAIEGQPDKFAARTWETQLGNIGSFLEVAKRQKRNTNPLWEAIESQPDKFAACAWKTPLDQLGSFLEIAKRQKRNTNPLWEAIERQPDKFAARAWDSSLDTVASFLEVAKQQGRDTNHLWSAIESQPDKLAVRAWETSLEKLSSFLEVAKRQKRNTNPLWEAIERQPDRFGARAWETSLEHVAHFFEVSKQEGRNTNPLWTAIERQPYKFAARAWETSLEHVAHFFEVAKQEKRDTTPLWEAVESQPEKLAVRIWDTSLDGIGSFIYRAGQDGRDMDRLWSILESDPDGLSDKGEGAELKELVGFGHYAPIALMEVALRNIRPGQWNATPHTQGMAGATWLAWNCGKAGRTDLASDLIAVLLHRANPWDFQPRAGGFGQACWLVANVPPSATELVEPFLKAVCTNKWLQIAYREVACGQLASGLRQVALHQTVERCRRFRHLGLAGRLYKELARFGTADAKDQSQIIQLLGCTGLCGSWAVSLHSLTNINLEIVSDLPVNIEPHRPETTRVEDRQIQLWLGLRAFVSIAKMRLPIAPYVIEKTLELWRENLTETGLEPTSTPHLVNQSMVKWLESCLSANPVALLPSAEPLWTLVGFPVRLDLSER